MAKERSKFLTMPIGGSVNVTSPFGMRVHPVTGKQKMHQGVDLGCPIGTPIYAPNEAIVTRIVPVAYTDDDGEETPPRAGGNELRIQLSTDTSGVYDGAELTFLHLSRIDVADGQELSVGQQIGLTGNTGRSTGPHLHLQVIDLGSLQDPVTYFPDGVTPTDSTAPSVMEPFEEQFRKSLELLTEWRNEKTVNQVTESEVYNDIAYQDTINNGIVAITSPVLGFVEERSPSFNLDALIFIQGVDVSDYLEGSVTAAIVDVQGNNTLSFTLSNADDKFVWTEKNLQKLLRPMPTRSRPPAGVFDNNETIKKSIFNFKTNPDINPTYANEKNTPFNTTFTLLPNVPIFQKMDPVRVFIKVPTFPSEGRYFKGKRCAWMPFFAGHVDNVTLEDDDLTGKSSLQVECADIRQTMLRRMRISFDYLAAGIYSADSIFGVAGSEGIFDPRHSLFYDQIVPQQYGQPFEQKPLEQAVKELLVSSDASEFVAQQSLDNINLTEAQAHQDAAKQQSLVNVGSDQLEKNPKGVRYIQDAGLYVFDASAGQTEIRSFLENWHRCALFGPKRRPWTHEEVEYVGQRTKTRDQYDVNNARLWRLFPVNGSGQKNIAEMSSLSTSPVHDVNWNDRDSVLKQLVQTLAYNMFVAPSGDIFVEFGMEDFRPEDFGEFATVFKYEHHRVSTTMSDDNGDIPCAVIATTGWAQGVGSPDALATNLLEKAMAFSPTLASKFGIRVEPKGIPFFYREQSRAAQIAAVELQKLLADTSQMTVNSKYRPFFLPNRPVEHVRRTRMGNVTNVSNSFNFGSQPSGQTSVTVNHVRRWSGLRRSNLLASADRSPNGDNVIALSIASLSPAQKKVLAKSLGKSVEALEDKDLYLFEQNGEKIYFTVAGGETTPMTNRGQWGVGKHAIASGIYLLPQDEKKTT